MHIMQASGRKYPDGSEYSGPLRDQDGIRHGERATVKMADGSTYMGQCEDGLFEGLGTLNSSNGNKYAGEFAKGKFQGFGVLTCSNGLIYQGEFRDGKVFGKGRIIFPDGTNGQLKQEGIFENLVLKTSQKCEKAVERAIKISNDAQQR